MGRFDDKTEEPTEQRKRKAREDGTVARSQEVGAAVSLLGLLLVLRVLGPGAFSAARDGTEQLLAGAAAGHTRAGLGADAVGLGLGFAAPFLGVSVVLTLVAGLSQTGLRLSPKAARPKLSKLSPKQGLEKLRPSTAVWELVRTATKLALLGGAVAAPLAAWPTQVVGARSLADALADTAGLGASLLLRVALLALVVAAADYAWNRRRTKQQMRMSKEEVKREHKDSEGDPLIKGQRRRRAMELSRNRMFRDVASADVLVVNPTHIAIGLRYDPAEGAPRVVARGAGHVAAKLRAEAHRHGVPVTQDKPLARALYRRCRVGQHVPAALFEAVAIVLAMAYRRRGRAIGAGAAA